MVKAATAAVAALIAAMTAMPAQAFSPPGNRIINPGAEAPGLDGWQGAGFAPAAYGSAERYPPLEPVAAQHYGDGTQLFAATQRDAQITQTIHVGDLSASIDAGQRPTLAYGGDFGAQAGSEDTSRITVQPQDDSGAPTADAQIVGQPTAADRDNQTTLLNCIGWLQLPPRTRAVQVTLQALGATATSTAMADSLFLTSERVAIPAISESTVPAQGPGCRTRIPRPLPSLGTTDPRPMMSARPVPKLTSLLLLPAARRCGKPPVLRFRVATNWRSKVEQMTIAARGRRLQAGPHRWTLLRGPTDRLLVRFTVRLKDGRVRIGARRFVGCAD